MGLQNDQYNIIMREYDKKQHLSRHLLEKKYQEVYSKIPEMLELDNTISNISVTYAKMLLHNDKEDLTDLEEEICKIKKQKQDLLLKSGYSSDFLEQEYECNECKDTGFIGNEKCHCFKQKIVNLLYAQSNLQDILRKENFSSFCYDYYPDDEVDASTGLTAKENIKKIVKVAKEFIKHFDEKTTNLLLYGNTGVGKTFLANCIAKELLDRFHTVIYLTSYELFDILEKNKFAYSTTEEEARASYSFLFTCDLLIIDDLGTELNNSFVSSQLYHIINERILANKSTICSTNLSFHDLRARYSERIFSRITSNYILLKLTGYDIRLKKAIEYKKNLKNKNTEDDLS